MPSSGILRLVALVRNDVSEERITLMMEALCSSETSVLVRATRRSIPEDDLLKSRIFLFYPSRLFNASSTRLDIQKGNHCVNCTTKYHNLKTDF
jgi:hypothetical protein